MLSMSGGGLGRFLGIARGAERNTAILESYKCVRIPDTGTWKLSGDILLRK
jgi:hypothetical protein